MSADTQTTGVVIEKWVRNAISNNSSIPILGLSGSQGIGKTTALNKLENAADLQVALLSLDDFYLTKTERDYLANSVHPLCATRGAPGTHDIGLLSDTIQMLQSAEPTDVTNWPKFDKVTDDRSENLNEFVGAPDAILLEGWLIGAVSDTNASDDEPINLLERNEDTEGVWRAWQETALVRTYEPLWHQFDEFLYLCAPSFETVFGWRCEQEETTLGLEKGSLPNDRAAWVARFIQHYERITRRILSGQRMPGREVRVSEKRAILAH